MPTPKKYLGMLLFFLIAGYAAIAFAGDPIHGVDVKLGSKDGKVYKATTDQDGKFDLGNVPDGDYDLYCSYEQCAKMAINSQWPHKKKGSSARFQIDLPNNGTTATLAHDIATGKNGSDNRSSQTNTFTITEAWSSTSPSLHVTIRGMDRMHRYIGHVTIVK